MRKRLVVAATVYFCGRYVALTGRITCTRRDAVIQVSASDSTVMLNCTVDNCGIRGNVDLRFASHDWMCSVGLTRIWPSLALFRALSFYLQYNASDSSNSFFWPTLCSVLYFSYTLRVWEFPFTDTSVLSTRCLTCSERFNNMIYTSIAPWTHSNQPVTRTSPSHRHSPFTFSNMLFVNYWFHPLLQLAGLSERLLSSSWKWNWYKIH